MADHHDRRSESDRRIRDVEHTKLVSDVDEIKREQAAIRDDQAAMRAELKRNNELTEKNNSMTEELFELFAAAKGTFKFFGWIGKAITWAGGVAVAGAAIWAIITHGGVPPK